VQEKIRSAAEVVWRQRHNAAIWSCVVGVLHRKMMLSLSIQQHMSF